MSQIILNKIALLKHASLGIALVGILLIAGNTVHSSEWMTWPSTYTHDSRGVPVDQYAQPVQPLGPNRVDVVRSGFRHFRSTLQAGQSADNYHRTEQWGDPVVPYEHWRFPFRPYGVPYEAWGPPTPYGMFLGTGFGLPQWPYPVRPGFGGPGMNHPDINNQGMPGAGWGGQGSWGGQGGWGGTGGWNGQGGWAGQGGWGMGGMPGNFGFPLQPPYMNQPWFDGYYPDAPPFHYPSDRDFFWKPRTLPPVSTP